MFFNTYMLRVGEQMELQSRVANNLIVNDTREGSKLVNKLVDNIKCNDSERSDSLEILHNVSTNREQFLISEINHKNMCEQVVDNDKDCDDLQNNSSDIDVKKMILKLEEFANKNKKVPPKNTLKKHSSNEHKRSDNNTHLNIGEVSPCDENKTKSKESIKGYDSPAKCDPKSIWVPVKSCDENSDQGDGYIEMCRPGAVKEYISIIEDHVYEEMCFNNGSLDKNVKEVETSPKKFDKLSELIETEKTYLQSLSRIIKDYMPYVNEYDAPENALEDSKYIFGNVQNIYDGHLHEMSGLLSCQTPKDVAICFAENERILDLYPHYIRNKPKSDEIMQNKKEYKTFFLRKQTALKDMLDLSSYLLAPIQRLAKYRLLLQDLIDQCKGEEKVLMEKAVNIVKKNLIKGNDYIALDCIRNCKVEIDDQGQLLLRDQFRCIKMNENSGFEAMVFLFEKMLIVTEIHLKSSTMEYEYKDSIKMTDLGITKMDCNVNEFKIWYQRHNKLNYTLFSKDSFTKKKWTDNIVSRLWEQLKVAGQETKFLEENDHIALDRIRNCEVKIADQGQLLLRDHFKCMKMNEKVGFEAMVFLFEKMIVLTEIQLQGNKHYYEYKDSINITDLGITELDFNDNEFKIWYRKHNKLNYTLYTNDFSIKKKWTGDITWKLWTQLEMTKGQKMLHWD